MIKRKPLPESRVCKECGNEFKPKTPLHVCSACTNKKAREKFRLQMEEKKKEGTYIPYRGVRPEGMPEDFEVRRKEYAKVQKLTKHMDREEYRIYLHNKLNEIIENKPLWLYLTRPGLGETPKKESIEASKGNGRGRKKKTNLDTRNMNWDEYEQGGYYLPEDE